MTTRRSAPIKPEPESEALDLLALELLRQIAASLEWLCKKMAKNV